MKREKYFNVMDFQIFFFYMYKIYFFEYWISIPEFFEAALRKMLRVSVHFW